MSPFEIKSIFLWKDQFELICQDFQKWIDSIVLWPDHSNPPFKSKLNLHCSTLWKALKKPLNLWSWSHLAGPHPPLFGKLWLPLGFFVRNVFLINWAIQVCIETHFWVCLKQTLVRESFKKNFESVIRIIPCRNRVKRQDLYGHLFWK